MKAAHRLWLLWLALAACDQNMIDQPKSEDYEISSLFANGMVNQTPVAGTVARGDLHRDSVLEQRPPLTRNLLARGRVRYEIYCVPCHGGLGDGRGMVVLRGFPQPPSFHSERLRAFEARNIVRVITDGKGDMFSYSARIEPSDRWAIAAYVKALQLSQRFAAASLTDSDRAKLAPWGKGRP